MKTIALLVLLPILSANESKDICSYWYIVKTQKMKQEERHSFKLLMTLIKQQAANKKEKLPTHSLKCPKLPVF